MNSSFQDVGTHPPFLKPFITPSATCPSLSLEVARSLIPTKHMHTSKHVCTHTHIHTDTCLGSHRHTHLHTAEELCPEGHGCGGLIHTPICCTSHMCTHLDHRHKCLCTMLTHRNPHKQVPLTCPQPGRPCATWSHGSAHVVGENRPSIWHHTGRGEQPVCGPVCLCICPSVHLHSLLPISYVSHRGSFPRANDGPQRVCPGVWPWALRRGDPKCCLALELGAWEIPALSEPRNGVNSTICCWLLELSSGASTPGPHLHLQKDLGHG